MRDSLSEDRSHSLFTEEVLLFGLRLKSSDLLRSSLYSLRSYLRYSRQALSSNSRLRSKDAIASFTGEKSTDCILVCLGEPITTALLLDISSASVFRI